MNRVRALEASCRAPSATWRACDARVHLVLPRRRAFSREPIVLTMQGGQRLDRVQAVLHLVAMAVPGSRRAMSPSSTAGAELLARGGQTVGSGAASQEDMRRAQELRLSRSIEEMLERTLGRAGCARRPASTWISTASRRGRNASTPRIRS